MTLRRFRKELMQFFKFCLVGLSNTVVSYLLYIGALFALQRMLLFPSYDYLVAQAVSYTLSILWAYYWNNRIVFMTEEGSHRVWWKVLIKTFVLYSVTGLLLSGVLLVFWVEVCGISRVVAPLLNLVMTVPLNYLLNKYWAFQS